jgi:hypothetical protein
MKLPLYNSSLILAASTLILRPQVGDQPYLAWRILKIKTTKKKKKRIYNLVSRAKGPHKVMLSIKIPFFYVNENFLDNPPKKKSHVVE